MTAICTRLVKTPDGGQRPCGHPAGDHAKRVVPLSPHTPLPPAPPCLRDGCSCEGFQAPLLDLEEEEAVDRMERFYEKGLDRPWGDA